MRWVFATLVIMNAVGIIWSERLSANGASQDTMLPALSPGADRLVLREELGSAAARNELPGDECWRVGPFGEQVSAKQLKMRLEERGFAVRLEEVGKTIATDYWVYLPASGMAAEGETKLEQFKAAGIDHFRIVEGEMKGGISFGVFARREGAEHKLGELREQGVSAALTERPRLRTELWASFEARQGGKEMSAEDLQLIKRDLLGASQTKLPCSTIAYHAPSN